jgi:hypothetical protein
MAKRQTLARITAGIPPMSARSCLIILKEEHGASHAGYPVPIKVGDYALSPLVIILLQ